MAHQLENVSERLLPFRLYADTEYTFKFTVKDQNGDTIDVSNDSFTFKAWDRTAESQIWSVSCNITDASNGIVKADITPSNNDTATEAVFELLHDIGDDGDEDGRVQWSQELHETIS